MHWLDYFIIATYIAQIYQVCFFAVPSAGSTAEMLVNRKNKSRSAERHPGATVVHSAPHMIGAIGATLAVLAASMIPLLAVVFPVVNHYLWLFIKLPPSTAQSIVSAGLLLLGNSLTFIAVGTLRANVSFHDFGETTRLYAGGIYRAVRNPITLGLGIIFAGLVLARPSVVMLIGWIIFALNSHYRIHMEEVYLEKTFGNDYRHYRDRVGKYFPRVGRHGVVKVRKFADDNVKSHHADTIQE
ncbi:MAG: isoprenylcysteine carboxylmethyltransferase family protein [Deltaproteobacteria bacterium]|jgi:protein-S-isoprenylcysteine O-methyltransferase Ste14|nr:isoprenylcysteine carboxylmethyltransferase family protein [Deltaproteobacteria bacterium]